MSGFLVMFDEEATPWRIRPEEFEPRVLSAWPDVAINVPEVDEYEVYWDFEASDGPVRLALMRGRTCLSVDGQAESAVEVAILLRSAVPEEIELLLCDDGLNFSIDVTAEMSPADLLSVVDEAP